MFPVVTWRAVFRIPLIRDNRDAVRILNDTFYLLLALHRARRFNDAGRLQKLYFYMIDSFARYCRTDAKDTLERLLSVPWFAERKRQVYALIATYTHIVDTEIPSLGGESLPAKQMAYCAHVRDFVKTFKELNEFGEQDEARVRNLLANPELMDRMLEVLFESLDMPFRHLPAVPEPPQLLIGRGV